jgi:hypothetical protein
VRENFSGLCASPVKLNSRCHFAPQMFGQLLDLLQVVARVPGQLIVRLLDLRWHSLRQLLQFLCLLPHRARRRFSGCVSQSAVRAAYQSVFGLRLCRAALDVKLLAEALLLEKGKTNIATKVRVSRKLLCTAYSESSFKHFSAGSRWKFDKTITCPDLWHFCSRSFSPDSQNRIFKPNSTTRGAPNPKTPVPEPTRSLRVPRGVPLIESVAPLRLPSSSAVGRS